MVDGRDDEDNESAVRALNTAMQQQAHALSEFLQDEGHRPVQPPRAGLYAHDPLAIQNAPSDETSSFLFNVPESTTHSTAVRADQPLNVQPRASLLGDPPATFEQQEDEDADDDKDDEESDTDDIEEELQQLRASELLLQQEIERVNIQAQSSLEQLSSTVLDATDNVCSSEENGETLKTYLSREQQGLQGLKDPSFIGTAHKIMDTGELDGVMDNVMETMLDAVLEGCQGYMDGSQTKKKRRSRPTKTSESQTTVPKTNVKPRRATFPESVAPSSTGNDRSSRQDTSAYSTNVYSTSGFSYEESEETTETSEQFYRKLPSKRTRSDSALQKNASISRLETERNSDSAGEQGIDMPQQIQFKKNRKASSNGREPAQKVSGNRNKRPSLLDKAKSLSKNFKKDDKVPDNNNKKKDRSMNPAIAGTKSMDSSDGSRDHEKKEADVENPGEGQEVEAFYQQKLRMSLCERVMSPEQRKEWKSKLFKREWLGVKRVCWVLLLLVTLITLLFGIVLAVTDSPRLKQGNGSGNDFVPEPYMESFPPYTQFTFQDPASAQARAYEWLVNDPMFDKYSDERKVQRFALATLYYSTNGENWISANRLLQYNTDECQWFYSRDARNTPPVCAVAGGLIESLDLKSNNLQGTIPPELFLMTNLKYLSLADNQLLSTIPNRGLDSMTNLEVLDLSDSGLSGPIPKSVGYLESLELLDLSKNRLTGTFPVELKFLSNLQELRLQNNGLTGLLPGHVLTGMKSLKQLYLFENSLRGPLPRHVGQLQALEDLLLYDNLLSSILPTELGLLKRLQRLCLDRNRFTGTIPRQLGHLQDLVQLQLYDNRLTGTIPAALAGAIALEQLQLQQNSLTGYVPDRLCYLLPKDGDNDIVRVLSVDCEEVTCDCDCTCPRQESKTSDLP